MSWTHPGERLKSRCETRACDEGRPVEVSAAVREGGDEVYEVRKSV